jgi:DNA topoisomerase-1
LFAQPKQRRFGATAAAPVRELGEDPDSGGQITLRMGRFGPYVTDGTVNASLRKGDDEATIAHERAVELLAMKREAGPAPRRARATKKATAKKTTARKTTATKTTAKKTVAKKAPAKKAPAKKATATKASAQKATGSATRTP